MRVVPECSSLIGYAELVKERVSWGNGTLVDSSRAVGPVTSLLKDAMPMLKNVSTPRNPRLCELTILVLLSMVVSVKLSMTLSENVSPLRER